MYPPSLGLPREDVDFVRVLAHVKRRLAQPELFPLPESEAERDVLHTLRELGQLELGTINQSRTYEESQFE